LFGYCLLAAVEDIRFGFVVKFRCFPFGAGDGGWRLLNNEQNPEECDATGDDSSNTA
jgi:hypothetical protein